MSTRSPGWTLRRGGTAKREKGKGARAAAYAAFVDADALARWLPPAGTRGRFEVFDPRVGGAFEMTLTYTRARPGGFSFNYWRFRLFGDPVLEIRDDDLEPPLQHPRHLDQLRTAPLCHYRKCFLAGRS